MSIIGLMGQVNWEEVWAGALIGGCVGALVGLVVWLLRRGKGGGDT